MTGVQTCALPICFPVTIEDALIEEYNQQSEWEVEVLTEPMNLDEIKEQGKGFLNSNTRKPKLDSNGCFMLKRIL